MLFPTLPPKAFERIVNTTILVLQDNPSVHGNPTRPNPSFNGGDACGCSLGLVTKCFGRLAHRPGSSKIHCLGHLAHRPGGSKIKPVRNSGEPVRNIELQSPAVLPMYPRVLPLPQVSGGREKRQAQLLILSQNWQQII